MNLDGYVSTERAAEVLGVKVASVYLYVRRLDGFPQPTKVGRTLLFRETDLIAWRASHPSRKPKGSDSPPA